jgi:hypothetical protein
VAEHSGSSQSTRAGAMGTSFRIARPVDSPAPSSASLSRQTLRRSPSCSVRAVCVNALVRICAGGGQRWSSLPRQLPKTAMWETEAGRQAMRRSTFTPGLAALVDALLRIGRRYGHVADISNGVTSGINASRRLDATFAIANPNPASPVLRPDGQQEVSWTAARPTTRTMR